MLIYIAHIIQETSTSSHTLAHADKKTDFRKMWMLG